MKFHGACAATRPTPIIEQARFVGVGHQLREEAGGEDRRHQKRCHVPARIPLRCQRRHPSTWPRPTAPRYHRLRHGRNFPV